MNKRSLFTLFGIAAGLALQADAHGSEVLGGPIAAQVVRVVDGDTIVVRARIWLGQDVETLVRLDGIDTPELHGRCERERLDARRAQAWLEQRLGGGEVLLHDVAHEKYGGRVLARVWTADGTDLAAGLVAAGLAHPYEGGRKRPWCG